MTETPSGERHKVVWEEEDICVTLRAPQNTPPQTHMKKCKCFAHFRLLFLSLRRLSVRTKIELFVLYFNFPKLHFVLAQKRIINLNVYNKVTL